MARNSRTAVETIDPIVPARPLALTAGKAVGEGAVAAGRSATLFGKAAAISFQGARKVSAAQDEALLAQLRAEYGL
jgi:hypothetical protein